MMDRKLRRPVPAFDLGSNGFIACLAAAGIEHIAGARERPIPIPATRATDQCCLFCRAGPKPDGGAEHILSVALGNHFWVLPPGAVCASCNHGVLSQLDSALLKHPFISLARVLANVPGRSGQPPSTRASNLSLMRDEDGVLHVQTNHPRHVNQEGDELQATLSWQNFGPKQHRTASRAVLKFGLGLIRLIKGAEETDRSKYDHVRGAVMGDDTVAVRHGFGNSSLPNHALQGMAITHDETRGMRMTLDCFGIELWAETDGWAHETTEEFRTTALTPEIGTHDADPSSG